jgi:hypothetical protein
LLAQALKTAYRDARLEATAETGLPVEAFPAETPWATHETLDGEIWPG